MTKSEAINVLQLNTPFVANKEVNEAVEMAIKALECKYDCEIKHLTNECSYSETGCSDCRGKLKIKEALEKQIAKKPKYLPLKEGITTTNYECPICGCRRLGHGIDLDKCYCPECGQKLDWSEV